MGIVDMVAITVDVFSGSDAVAHELQLPLHLVLKLGALLAMRLLNMRDEALLVVDFFDELVLQVDHGALQLLELEAILALHFLLGSLEHLRKVALQHVD